MTMETPKVVILCKDLILKTKIKELLKTSSRPCEFLKKNFTDLISSPEEQLEIIADLELLSLEEITLLGERRVKTPATKLLGFCSHMEVEKIQHAKSCSFDFVIPRSKLETVIPDFV